MSSLIVDVCTVEEIAVHPNADLLERVRVKNWWCVASKGHYKVGDKAVYVPPNSILPEALAERWGITKYCVPLGRDISGNQPPGLRVKAGRFRGIVSFGTIQDPDNMEWPIGLDVREIYGITKYEPPLKAQDGDAASPIHAFHAYTDIEALGNFPNVFMEDEVVIVTEKIHGTNSRVGLVYHADPEIEGFAWMKMAGSHGTRRKEFNEKGARSKYWFPFAETENCPMTQMMKLIVQEEKAQSSVIVFGEIFGVGIQDLQYGQSGLSHRVFDIAVDGNYLDYWKAFSYLKQFEIECVPLLYHGPYSLAKMDELVDGPTTICDTQKIKEKFKGREGIVIKPLKERFDPILGGRAILKYVSADYHERKNGTEFH